MVLAYLEAYACSSVSFWVICVVNFETFLKSESEAVVQVLRNYAPAKEYNMLGEECLLNVVQ